MQGLRRLGSVGLLLVVAWGCDKGSPSAPAMPVAPTAATPMTYSGVATLVGPVPQMGVASYECIARQIRRKLGRSETLTATFTEEPSNFSGTLYFGLLDGGPTAPHSISQNIGHWGIGLDFRGTYPNLDRTLWSSCTSSGVEDVFVHQVVVPASSSGSIRGEGRLIVYIHNPREGYFWDGDPRASLEFGIRVDLVRQ